MTCIQFDILNSIIILLKLNAINDITCNINLYIIIIIIIFYYK